MNFYSIRELRTDTKAISENIRSNGEAIITNNSKPAVLMLNISEDDRPFFEVAKICNAPLITGNIRDYPEDPLITGLADFCRKYL